MLVKIFEFSIIILAMWLLITQVSIPVFRGTKLFPLFRREEKLRSELEEARQKTLEKKLEKKIREARGDYNRKMSSIVDDEDQN